jgi:hypothetical protein
MDYQTMVAIPMTFDKPHLIMMKEDYTVTTIKAQSSTNEAKETFEVS